VSTHAIELPLLPLRDVVVYPHMVLPLFVGRERSIEALENAMANDKQVLLVAQRNAAEDDPGADDIYQVGTVSNILQLLKLPDGTIKVLVEGASALRSTTSTTTVTSRSPGCARSKAMSPTKRARGCCARPPRISRSTST
jgi:ATP-dependent Lon protease